MTFGYWIVTATVACASLAVVLATIDVLPEWRVPRRRKPRIVIIYLAGERGNGVDPANAQWRSALEVVIHRFDTEVMSDGDLQRDPTIDAKSIDRIVRIRPNGVIIAGAPDLILAGGSLAAISAVICAIVERLAVEGCRSFIIGLAAPPDDPAAERASLDTRALTSFSRACNDAVFKGTESSGGYLVSSPPELTEIIERHGAEPLVIDVDSETHEREEPRRWSNTPTTS